MSRSPYVDTREGAALLLFDNTKRPERNFLRYVKRHSIATFRRGKKVLVLRDSLISQLAEDDKAARSRA